MTAVQRRNREQVDDAEVEAQERRKVQERHKAHLRDFAGHLRDTDWSGKFSTREFQNNLIQGIHHHVENGPCLLYRE